MIFLQSPQGLATLECTWKLSDMKSRPLVESISIVLLLVVIGFVTADLAVLYTRGEMFPTPPPPSRRIAPAPAPAMGGNYTAITSRNIFNADGVIPSTAVGTDGQEKQKDADPVPSQLPLQLMGTIVHVNPDRSVATVNLKSQNNQVPVRTGGIIPDNLATVIKIERNKMIFRNMANQRLEFIVMDEESKISFGAATTKPAAAGGPTEVVRRSDTDFEVRRDEISRLTSNLPELLQQARAVPRMGPNGIECFTLADIMPGSIYESLGLQRGDCIKSVNGEKIDSPAKAMELYNALRANANSINLGVERGGRDQSFNYNITN